MDIQNWLEINKENIIKVIELEDITSRSDPCEQPYKSQYAAREVIQSCISNLDEWMKQDTNRLNYLSYFVYFNLSYRLANNFISTEERFAGEEIIHSLCKQIEEINQLSDFLKRLNKKIIKEKSNTDESQLWIQWLAGILLRIYNAYGLIWAGKILNLPQSDQSEIENQGSYNSIKYLSYSKRIYKIFKLLMHRKDKIQLESKTELSLTYKPPHCLDSLLLNMFQYETPYFKNECYFLEGVEKKEALKFDVFESDYTTTLFLLAQTYSKMSCNNQMKHKSAKYCYWTLYRQLNALKYDPVEWSLNAATLSQYYITENIFKRARHCIAAAQIIIKEAIVRPIRFNKDEDQKALVKNTECDDSKFTKSHEINKEKYSNGKKESFDNNDNVPKTDNQMLDVSTDKSLEILENKDVESNSTKINRDDSNEKENCDKKERCKSQRLLPDPMSESRLWDDDVYEEKRIQADADINRCWVSYGLNLLELSFDRKTSDCSSSKEKDKFIIESQLPDFNLELATIEREVTSDWVYCYDEARKLFLFIQKKINIARQYYTLDFRCSDAIELICDYSKAFKTISNFEGSIERQCIMHKKRIDMLSELLKTLNQRYYQVPCRKMMLEVGEIYSTMMNLKLSLLEISTGSDDSIKLPSNAKSVVQKIRLLGKKGIDTYEKFLNSYRNQNGALPKVFAEDDIRPILIAYFYMARIYSKILEPEISERLKNLVNSLQQYQFIVDYCNTHELAGKLMAPELESCKDMVILLPHKIDKLRSEC